MPAKQSRQYEISGFHHSVDEIVALLGWYAAYVGSCAVLEPRGAKTSQQAVFCINSWHYCESKGISYIKYEINFLFIYFLIDDSISWLYRKHVNLMAELTFIMKLIHC